MWIGDGEKDIRGRGRGLRGELESDRLKSDGRGEGQVCGIGDGEKVIKGRGKGLRRAGE